MPAPRPFPTAGPLRAALLAVLPPLLLPLQASGQPGRDVCGSEIVAAAPIRTASPLPLRLVGP